MRVISKCYPADQLMHRVSDRFVQQPRRAPTARRSRRRGRPLSQAKGEPSGSRTRPSLAWRLHTHRYVGVCSIGLDELIAVLLLRHQRGHAVPPAPRLWNGRGAELRCGRRRAGAPHRSGSPARPTNAGCAARASTVGRLQPRPCRPHRAPGPQPAAQDESESERAIAIDPVVHRPYGGCRPV
jgi:hypothetical protein